MPSHPAGLLLHIQVSEYVFGDRKVNTMPLSISVPLKGELAHFKYELESLKASRLMVESIKATLYGTEAQGFQTGPEQQNEGQKAGLTCALMLELLVMFPASTMVRS